MKLNKQLFSSSVLFVTCLVLWPFFMAISQPQGTLEEKFQWIIQNQTLFKSQFFIAFLIGPSLIFMMVSQLKPINGLSNKTDMLGYIFIGAYLVLCSVSYGAQFIILPNLIIKKLDIIAQVIYFDSESSFTYFLNQTGYFFWALGAIVLFFKAALKKNPFQIISVIYLISAVLSIIAFLGLILNNKIMNSMTFVSGIILLPAGIISIIRSVKPNQLQ